MTTHASNCLTTRRIGIEAADPELLPVVDPTAAASRLGLGRGRGRGRLPPAPESPSQARHRLRLPLPLPHPHPHPLSASAARTLGLIQSLTPPPPPPPRPPQLSLFNNSLPRPQEPRRPDSTPSSPAARRLPSVAPCHASGRSPTSLLPPSPLIPHDTKDPRPALPRPWPSLATRPPSDLSSSCP
ncbi:hypothetical protein IWX90DRAFT_301563 [Phyllosticta citrichinensis]|uniref:Uncharacterized protein n=1 Tax=Phyllosticta citrichinensis TaxID=1130410 RepID=A0ABR1XLF9_9PEZI